jgi:hypothetical protein
VLHAELSAVLGSERFLEEIELTASLQHPHSLPLFHSGSADGLLYEWAALQEARGSQCTVPTVTRRVRHARRITDAGNRRISARSVLIVHTVSKATNQGE